MKVFVLIGKDNLIQGVVTSQEAAEEWYQKDVDNDYIAFNLNDTTTLGINSNAPLNPEMETLSKRVEEEIIKAQEMNRQLKALNGAISPLLKKKGAAGVAPAPSSREAYWIIWAVTPENKLISKKLSDQGQYTHADWFRDIGLPSAGPEFDKILRGRISVNPRWKEVELYTHLNQYTPKWVWEELRRKYYIPDFSDPAWGFTETKERENKRWYDRDWGESKLAAAPAKAITTGSIIWVVAPDGKLHTKWVEGADPFNHAGWFRELGLPTHGRAFDNLLRGRISIDAKRKSVWMVTHEGQYTPEQVWRELKRLYYIPVGLPEWSFKEAFEREYNWYQRKWDPRFAGKHIHKLRSCPEGMKCTICKKNFTACPCQKDGEAASYCPKCKGLGWFEK